MSKNTLRLTFSTAILITIVGGEQRVHQCAAANIIGGLRNVAMLGDSLPGVSPEVRIEQFGFPRVDAQGRTAFKARLLQGVGGTVAANDTAIWSEVAADDLRFVAREGDLIPNLNFRFNEVEPGENLRMSDGGDTYFIAGISSAAGPTVGSSGIFRFSPTAGLEFRVASSFVAFGVPVAGGPGEYFSNFLDFNEQGDIAMQTGSGFGPIWTLESNDAVSMVTSSGSFQQINEFGDVVHRVVGESFVNRIEVWNRNVPTPRIVATENGIAPNTSGARFRMLGQEDSFTNSAGTVTFVGRLYGTDVNDSNDFGIWSESTPGGPVKLDLREGQQAPGVGAGVFWSGFSQYSVPIVFGRSGGTAIHLSLAGAGVVPGNEDGIWAGSTASDLHLVAREGDQAPGTEAGTYFYQFDVGQSGVTSDGRGVCISRLAGNAMDPNRDLGLWAEDINGSLQLIARTGDLVELPSGAFATLTSIQFSPEFGVGEKGHVAFLGGFSSGEFGVFVSNVVAVPEPASLLQAVASIVFVGRLLSAQCRRRSLRATLSS